MGPQVFEGNTGPEGLVEQQIDAAHQDGNLTVFLNADDEQGPRFRWCLKLGALAPVSEIAGVQARLNNLGFTCGAVDGILGPRTRSALRAFQKSQAMGMTGDNDAATRAALAAAHMDT